MSRSSQSPIATLTMNPSLDIATTTERVVPTHKLRCEAARRDPGGGGINVARVVHILGGQATAVYPAGGTTGSALQNLLDQAGIAHQRVIPIRDVTRESFTIDEAATGGQFRFVLPGPELTREEVQRCLDELGALEPRPAFVVASGSLPPGVPDDFYARVARLTRELGARLIVDTSGAALRHAGREGVFLLKPNLRELQGLVGAKVQSGREQEEAARTLIEEGRAEVVVLSLGADGALLVSRGATQRFAAIEVPKRSAVGAGDSMVAAIVLGLARGSGLPDAVRFGMAAGAAALMTPGTELCRREDVERLYAQALSGTD